MLSLLLVTLVAGLCTAQGPTGVSEYSDCATVNDITTTTCEKHLHYLKALNSDSYNFFMDITNLKDPIDLLNSVVVDKACNQSDNLGRYHECVFTNLRVCLNAVNSSQTMNLPDPTRTANAVTNLCSHQKDLNRTCYNDNKPEMDMCASRKFAEIQKQMIMGGMPEPEGEAVEEDEEEDEEEEVDHSNMTPEEHNTYHTQKSVDKMKQNFICSTYDNLLECLDVGMSDCEGYESAVREYFVSFRPHDCPEMSSSASLVGPLSLASLLLVFLFSRLL